MVKSLKESSLLIKRLSKTIDNEVKEQKEGLLSMLLGKLSASLLINLLTGIWVKAKKHGQGVIRAGEGKIRAGQDF